MHLAFDECVKSAAARGMRVTGSELVGLIPLKSMLDAGKYFLSRQQRSTGVSEEELIRIAVKSLGLDELTPLKPSLKKFLRYAFIPHRIIGKIRTKIQKAVGGQTLKSLGTTPTYG